MRVHVVETVGLGESAVRILEPDKGDGRDIAAIGDALQKRTQFRLTQIVGADQSDRFRLEKSV
ncbi:hypothetical protein [Breoghania sp.]|uniref:hypothetical protein n=1 Tax=Breoghania sp. TaxID=2065378 RepID=UPI0026265C42|nr:hypothetical protein [Breoghania sp.]MDJ0930099.1 hypothetical protein [Breoghania sp.]